MKLFFILEVLEAGSNYTMVISSNVKTILNRHAATNLQVNFSTVESFYISSRYPQPDSSEIPLAARIRVQFENEMNSNTFSAETFYLRNFNTGIVTPTVISFTNSSTAVLTPAELLQPDRVYEIICTKELENISNQPFGRLEKWKFTTAEALAPPTNFYPPDLSQNIPLNTNINIFFTTNVSEGINNSSFYLYYTNGSQTNTVPATVSLPTFPGSNLIMSPALNLLPDTYYTAVVTPDVVMVDGSFLATNFIWHFTTAPALAFPEYTLPAADTFFINPVSNITAGFSNAIDPTTVNSNSVKLFRNDGMRIKGNISYSVARQQIIFSPGYDLEQETYYNCVLTTDIKSSDGRFFSSNYSWSFKTGKIIGPDGGCIATADNTFKLYIPENCFKSKTVIRIEKTQPALLSPPPAGVYSISNFIYRIKPDGLVFNKPAMAAVNFSNNNLSPGTNCRIYRDNSSRWLFIGGSSMDNILRFELNNAGLYILTTNQNSGPHPDSPKTIRVYPRIANRGETIYISFINCYEDAAITIIDNRGNTIKKINKPYTFSAKNNVITWDQTDQNDRPAGSGVYIVLINNRQKGLLYRKLFLIK